MANNNRPDNMDNLKNASVFDNVPTTHVQGVPDRAVKDHVDKMTQSGGDQGGDNKYSLNDDRRVKVLSPGALVAKRFFRNKIAMVGLIVLLSMFLFSFLGGIISPYTQSQQFYRDDMMLKEYASAKESTELRYDTAPGQQFGGVIQAQLSLALKSGATEFKTTKGSFEIVEEGTDFYSVKIKGGDEIGIAFKDILSGAGSDDSISYEYRRAALKAYTNGETSFEAEGKAYTLDEDDMIYDDSGKNVGYISRYIVQAWYPDVFLTKEWKEALIESFENGEKSFTFTDADGEESEYELTYDPDNVRWIIKQERATRVLDTKSSPSWEHWLGTDKDGMDMLTRLMYGGRVSLIIGFIVEIISTVIGVILGGISGYFGGWVDNLIMRIVDVFYCVPSMPILIILGAALDQYMVPPMIRMIYLMLILGFLGWPGMARLVRGQILSLREQEFMTATEATGLSVRRRIFKHLVPNVIPQLIVSCTMGLGGTIITEATLSFLGLGVKYPFASWGNIISDVSDQSVLTNYWFLWIPAGVLLLVTVLAFNLVGDGLRDAFDPKMKR